MMIVGTQSEMTQLADLLIKKYKQQFSLHTADCCCDLVITVKDTQTVSLSGSGSELHPIVANLIVSKQPGNALTIVDDGAYVPSFAASAVRSPVVITGADFANATQWTGTNADSIVIPPSYKLSVFWNQVNRFLIAGEISRTPTGFTVINNGTTITGFDATGPNNGDTFLIFSSP